MLRVSSFLVVFLFPCSLPCKHHDNFALFSFYVSLPLTSSNLGFECFWSYGISFSGRYWCCCWLEATSSIMSLSFYSNNLCTRWTKETELELVRKATKPRITCIKLHIGFCFEKLGASGVYLEMFSDVSLPGPGYLRENSIECASSPPFKVLWGDWERRSFVFFPLPLGPLRCTVHTTWQRKEIEKGPVWEWGSQKE